MSNYDRKEHLKAIHTQRKAQTFQKVDAAIKKLIRSSGSINFNSVASEAGLSKATLYNHKEIRDRIEGLRNQQGQTPTTKKIKHQMDENNKDAIIASLQRRIKKLESENKQLREQLKVAYGEIYKKF